MKSRILKLPALPDTVSAAADPCWDKSKLVHRTCPVCGEGNDAKAVCVRPDGLDVHVCSLCGMVYLANVPDAAELDAFYRKYSAFKGYRVRKRKSWFQVMRAARSDHRIALLEKTGGLRGKNILEIGCSDGVFLQTCRWRGALVAGVEQDQHSCNRMRELGIPVGPHIDSEQHYDIVCAFNLLEHLAEPHGMLTAAARSLRKDGRFILSVPNAGEFHKTGPIWIGFRVDMEHVNYFDVKSLGRLLQEHDLYIEQYWEHSQPYLIRTQNSEGRDTVLQRVKRIAAGVCGISTDHMVDRGSYVLTLIARKY